MSRGFLKIFQIQLARTARIRRLLENELRAPTPSALRLVRLRRLQLIMRTRIEQLIRAWAIARASAPRLSRKHSGPLRSRPYAKPYIRQFKTNPAF